MGWVCDLGRVRVGVTCSLRFGIGGRPLDSEGGWRWWGWGVVSGGRGGVEREKV